MASVGFNLFDFETQIISTAVYKVLFMSMPIVFNWRGEAESFSLGRDLTPPASGHLGGRVSGGAGGDWRADCPGGSRPAAEFWVSGRGGAAAQSQVTFVQQILWQDTIAVNTSA